MKLLKRFRLWLIKKLRAIPEETKIELPKPKYVNIRPETLRVVRRLTVEEMYQLHDENTSRWMTESIIKDLKRQLVDAIIKSGAIRILNNDETGEVSASVMLVLDGNRPDWM